MLAPAPTKSIHIKTFGCQMNVYDSDRMEGILLNQGFRLESDLRKADVVLINTCSIREKAEQKVLSLLGELRPLKEKNPKRVIGITGCIGQRMGRKLLQKVPHLDLVMGPDSVDKVGELVEAILTEGTRLVDAKLDEDRTRVYSAPMRVQQARVSEFMTVMKGCDHFCTYCIVPFVRGREKSRPIPEILLDVHRLVKEGTREIVFLGQNINTYGKGTEFTLARLIEETAQIPEVKRIRYVTSHPRDLGADLIAQFGTVEKLCPQLHLPFQSGSNAVLKRMSRLYTREQYLEKVAQLRAVCPDLALSTDVIVGFPGETDADFELTLSLLREARFASAYLFKYSPRPGTKAYAMVDDVPESVKSERFAVAGKYMHDLTVRANNAQIGKRVSVLVEELDKKGRYFSGRTPQNVVVHVLNAGLACVGKVLDVEVTEANPSNLKGFYVGAPREHRKFEETVSPSL